MGYKCPIVYACSTNINVNVLLEYLAEVNRVEAAQAAEQKAQDLFDSGDTGAQGVVAVMERINKGDQLPLFYSGGFRVMANLLSTGNTNSASACR